jgi:hypothetical protein
MPEQREERPPWRSAKDKRPATSAHTTSTARLPPATREAKPTRPLGASASAGVLPHAQSLEQLLGLQAIVARQFWRTRAGREADGKAGTSTTLPQRLRKFLFEEKQDERKGVADAYLRKPAQPMAVRVRRRA